MRADARQGSDLGWSQERGWPRGTQRGSVEQLPTPSDRRNICNYDGLRREICRLMRGMCSNVHHVCQVRLVLRLMPVMVMIVIGDAGRDLLGRMTLEEKVMQMIALWATKSEVMDGMTFNPDKATRAYPNGFGQLTRASDKRGVTGVAGAAGLRVRGCRGCRGCRAPASHTPSQSQSVNAEGFNEREAVVAQRCFVAPDGGRARHRSLTLCEEQRTKTPGSASAIRRNCSNPMPLWTSLDR